MLTNTEDQQSTYNHRETSAIALKAGQPSQALKGESLLAHDLHLIKKGEFQKSANFSRPQNHALVPEQIGSLCMIVCLAQRLGIGGWGAMFMRLFCLCLR